MKNLLFTTLLSYGLLIPAMVLAQPFNESCALQYKGFDNGHVVEIGTSHVLRYLTDPVRIELWMYDPKPDLYTDIRKSQIFVINDMIYLVTAGFNGGQSSTNIQSFNRTGELQKHISLPYNENSLKLLEMGSDQLVSLSHDSLFVLDYELNRLKPKPALAGRFNDIAFYADTVYALYENDTESAYSIVKYNNILDSIYDHEISLTEADYMVYGVEIRVNREGELFVMEDWEHKSGGTDKLVIRKFNETMQEQWACPLEMNYVWPSLFGTMDDGGAIVCMMDSWPLIRIDGSGDSSMVMEGNFGLLYAEDSSYSFVNEAGCMAYKYSRKGEFLPWTKKVFIEHVEWYNPDKVLCMPDPDPGILLQLDAGMTGNEKNIVWSDGTEGNQLYVYEPGRYWASFSFDFGNIGYTDTFNVLDHYALVDRPEVQLIYDGEARICQGSSLDVQFKVTNDNGGDYTYEHIGSGQTFDGTIALSDGGMHYFTVTDSSGCTSDTSLELSIKMPYADPICMVTTDAESGKNQIIWNPSDDQGIDSYSVSRGLGQTPVGTVLHNGPNYLLDEDEDPDIQAFRYFLTSTDSCGNALTHEISHKTLHLSANRGAGGEVNLIWEPYEGVNVFQYNIYRRRWDQSEYTKIGGVEYDPSIRQWIDYKAPLFWSYYKIGIIGSFSCELLESRKSVTAPVDEIFSNELSMGETGTDDPLEQCKRLSVYPVPASEFLRVKTEGVAPSNFNTGLQLRLINQTGRIILEKNLNDPEIDIELPEGIAGGIYYLLITGFEDGGILTGKTAIR